MARDNSGVDGLKDKLYSRKNQGPMQDVRSPLTPDDSHAPVAWADATPPRPPQDMPALSAFEGGGGMKKQKRKMSLTTKFFIGSVAFFVIAASVALFFFFGGGNFISPNNIDLQIVAPSLVDGGSTVQLQILITNRNSAQLQLADLVLTYPQGTRDPNDPTKSLTSERQSIGTIAPGQQLKRTASAVFYGQEGSTQQVQVSLEYSIAGSNAVFTRDGSVSFTVGSSPVSLSVNAPPTATAGQPFTMDVTVQSNSQDTVDNATLEAQYPFGFTPTSASPQADSGQTLWRLGSLAAGASKIVHITGTIDGQDGDQRVFKFLVGSEADQTAAHIAVPFLTVPTTLTVSRPFISGSLTVAGKTGSTVAVTPGQTIQGSIDWQNNLTDPVANLEISLQLAGPVLDPNSVQSPNGFYQSSDNTITWSSAQDPELAQVAAGGSGTLDFSFATLPPGSGGTIYTNPKVTLTLNVKGTRGSDQTAESVSAVDSTDVVLGSVLSLTAQSYFSQGPYGNVGPVPPHAEVPTDYTVQWTAKNSSNAIANASVTAVLPTYVTFLAGQAGVTYDAPSRTVKWAIGDIAAGTGYTTGAQVASFQVVLNPSASQVGQIPALTGAALLQGTDRFAQIQVQAQAQGPTTQTSDGQSGVVAPK